VFALVVGFEEASFLHILGQSKGAPYFAAFLSPKKRGRLYNRHMRSSFNAYQLSQGKNFVHYFIWQG